MFLNTLKEFYKLNINLMDEIEYIKDHYEEINKMNKNNQIKFYSV